MRPIQLWHGAHNWQGPPQVRGARKGHAEAGPGLYLTTSYQTARKYARGGGATLRVTLDADLGWLEDATLSLADAVAFVQALRRCGQRTALVRDLRAYAVRLAPRLGGDTIHASALVNLAVNADAAHGDNGVLLAGFLVEHGIDASLHLATSTEDWVVVFNPKKILGVERVGAGDVPPEADMLLVRTQRTRA